MVGKVPLVRLKSIADLGPDRRDIHDGFKPTDQETEYPAFWGHDSEFVQTIVQAPNKHLMALARAKKGRNLRDAHLLWSRSGTLLISERLRLTTARIVAVTLNQKVLSNTWWPVAIDNRAKKSKFPDKVLALWLNSTLGLLSLIAARVDTEGAWIELKKPILEELAVPDVNRPSKRTEGLLYDAYDEVSKLPIQSLPSIDTYPVRTRIDAAIASAFGIDDDLTRLRNMLAREPIVSMRLPN